MYNIPWTCVEISLPKAPGHDMQVFLAWIAQGLDFKATESATLTCDAGAWHLPQDGGFQLVMGVPPIAGWFLLGEIPI